MVRRGTVLLLVLALVVLAAGCGGDVVARVDGQAITREQLDKRMDSIKAYYQAMGVNLDDPNSKGMLAEVEKQTLEGMIQEVLILKAAEKAGIEATDEEVAQHVELIKQQAGAEFDQLLQSQGLTEEGLKEALKTQLVQDKLFKQVTADIKVTPAEVESYYKGNKDDLALIKVRHILITAGDDASEQEVAQAKAKAEDLVKKLDQGGDFATLAKENSQDPGTKENGGLLDYYFSNQDVSLDPHFVAGAFGLNSVGSFTKEPVRSSFGFHLIKLEDKKDSLEALRADIEAALLQQKQNESFNQYLADLTEKATIENHLNTTSTQEQQRDATEGPDAPANPETQGK